MASKFYSTTENPRQSSETDAPPRTGYVIGEDNEFALRDLADAMEYVAEIAWYESDTGPDHSGKGLASLLRTFAKAARGVGDARVAVTLN
jgi:hypothetical protein